MFKKIILCVIGISMSFCLFAQSPGSVSNNLKVWFKSDAGVLGATPVTGWLDQSATGNDATVVGNGPDLLNNQVNFNSAMDFTRTNSEYLQITNGIFGNATLSDIWVYYVSKPTATNQRTTIFFEELTGTNEYFTGLNAWENGNAFLDFGGIASGGRLTGNAGTAAGRYNMWTKGSSSTTATPNGTNKTIYRDGQAVLSGNNHDPDITGNSQHFFIGGRYREVDGNYFDGQIAELIIYEDVPTELEQEKVQSYLAVKYGITKISTDNSNTAGQDERDYFASNGTVIWDYSADPSYINNITGIGRDDNSGLDQPKSKSINADGAVTIDKGGVFSSDRDFLLWADNGEVATSTDVPTGYTVRSKKVWKVDLTGSPGQVSFSIDLDAAGIQNTGIVADYALLIDADGTFSSGASVHITGATLVGDDLSFTNVSFGDGDFFAIAIDNFTAPFSPGNVSDDLQLWLTASAGVSGASPVTGWADQSGLNNDATVVGNGPDLLSGTINFNPALDFTRTNSEYLQITNGILGGRSYSNAWVYYVSKPNTVNQRTTIFFEELSGTTEYFGSLNAWENGNAFFDFGNAGAGGRITGNVGTTAGTYNFWTMGSSSSTSTPNGTNKVIYRDGVAIISSNTNDASITGSNQNLFIGGRFQETDGNYFDGEIAELIIYDEVPSELEQEKVQSYLALKYGISKLSIDNTGTPGQDERDYFDSDGTTIWDASEESTYNNLITGIGRDDISTLEQKQSRNAHAGSIVTIGLDDALTPDGLENTNSLNDGTFSADKNFLIWGNNGACLDCSEAKTNKEFSTTQVTSRLNREWYVQETGSTGTLTLEFDLSGLPGPTGDGTNNDDDVVLLIDADGDFSSGAMVLSQSFVVSSDNKAVFRADLADGVYFTLGSSEEIALPVSLVSFTAFTKEDHVVVNWVTASEEKNSHYRLERSTNGYDFDVLEQIPGAGNSNQLQTYEIIDERPMPGNNYYRLVDVSNSGDETNSELISIHFEEEIPNVLYPNPVKQGNELVVSLPDEFSIDDLDIRVLSMSGQRRAPAYRWNRKKLLISTGSLPGGMYLLRIANSKGEAKSYRFMVSH
ncbi:MAG: hypothetical protein Roseis2KO_47990 [Roseivirga sp.]